jgi:hypothetical protein
VAQRANCLIQIEACAGSRVWCTAAGRLTKTVRNHASNVFTKLQVSDRAEAIRRARAADLGG